MKKKSTLSNFISIIPSIDSEIKLFSYSIAAIVIVSLWAYAKPQYMNILCVVLLSIIILMIIYSFFVHGNISSVSRKVLSKTSKDSKGVLLEDITQENFKKLADLVTQNNKFNGQESYDLYIACPMASFPIAERELLSDKLLRLLSIIRKKYKFEHIECPASVQTNIDPNDTTTRYESPDKAFMLCFARILFSKRFVLILPANLPTSSIFELGLAVAFGKPITIFTQKCEQLPYLLREIHNVPISSLAYEFTGDIDEITKKISNKVIQINQ